MKNTIYVVTSGEYSDYGINAIFSTEDLAKKYISAFNQDGYDKMDVEEWDLDPNKSDLNNSKKAYFVRMSKEGETTETEWSSSPFGFDSGNIVSFTHDSKFMNCYCFAKDCKHAVKIANERRIQYIASDKWGLS